MLGISKMVKSMAKNVFSAKTYTNLMSSARAKLAQSKNVWANMAAKNFPTDDVVTEIKRRTEQSMTGKILKGSYKLGAKSYTNYTNAAKSSMLMRGITWAPRQVPKLGRASLNMAGRNPVKVALTAGLGYGMASYMIDKSKEKIANTRGMGPNHLSTDGLTLSLSRTRHR